MEGGSEGQEWTTEQVTVTLFPELISAGMDIVGCPGESAGKVKKNGRENLWIPMLYDLCLMNMFKPAGK